MVSAIGFLSSALSLESAYRRHTLNVIAEIWDIQPSDAPRREILATPNPGSCIEHRPKAARFAPRRLLTPGEGLYYTLWCWIDMRDRKCAPLPR